jgi:hypothetical protein
MEEKKKATKDYESMIKNFFTCFLRWLYDEGQKDSFLKC